MKIDDVMKMLNKHKKHASVEHDLQVSIVNLLRANNIFVVAVPNGGRRDAVTGSRLKKEGVLAGAADLVLILDDGETVWVELKTAKGRQSDNQKEFQSRLQSLSHTYLIWRTIDDCMGFIQSYRKTREDLCKRFFYSPHPFQDHADGL